MGVIQDPQGAYFIAWEPGERPGASLVNAPGALVWNDLQSPDIDASASFYGELFGWGLEEFDAMPDRYLMIKVGEASNGGIRGLGVRCLRGRDDALESAAFVARDHVARSRSSNPAPPAIAWIRK